MIASRLVRVERHPLGLFAGQSLPTFLASMIRNPRARWACGALGSRTDLGCRGGYAVLAPPYIHCCTIMEDLLFARVYSE
jgi:hypothetical protein